MNLSKTARCHIRMDSKWAYFSAISMGISVFIRTVYYFGLINLRDIGILALIMEVILPMLIAAGYLVTIKALRLNAPVLVSGLIGAYTLDYLFLMTADVAGIIGIILLVGYCGLFLATALGYMPKRMPVLATAGVMVAFRFLATDLIGILVNANQMNPAGYLPEASELFGLLALAMMAPALHITALPSAKEAQNDDSSTDVLMSE